MSPIPSKIKPLLNEFKDIVGDNIPTCLSPFISISNQIDLMQGSNLTNKSPYWMTDLGGYWWPPTYCIWTPLVSFSSTHSYVLVCNYGFYTIGDV
jgi:hypothetical protein